MSTKKITFYLFGFKLLRLLFSLITLPITANLFGVSIERDSWVLVTSFITVIGLTIWGPLNETFRAKFIFIKEKEGDIIALSKTVSLIVFMIFITLLIILFCYFFIDPIIDFFDFSNSNEAKAQLIKSLFLIMLPSLIINQIISIFTAILNSYDIFYIPEIVGTVSAVLNLLFIIYLTPIIGIYSLVVSQYVGIIFLILAMGYYIRKKMIFGGVPLSINFQGVWSFVSYSLPFFIPYFFGQINLFIEKYLANSVSIGAISELEYSRQFSLTLQGVILSLLTTIMVPVLAKNYARTEYELFSSNIKEYFNYTFLILCLTLPFLIGGADPLTELFFRNDSISNESLISIENLIFLYGISFIGVIVYLLFGLILLASDKARIYAFFGVIAQVIVVLLNILLFGTFENYVFPLSIGLGHLIVAIFFSIYVKMNNKIELYFTILRLVGIIAIISIIVYISNLIMVFEKPIIKLFINSLLILISLLFFSRNLGINVFINKFIKKSKK